MTRGTIAFIDDEAQLCRAAEDWLGASGFDVATYTSSDLALAQMEIGSLDCVVTDLRMPGSDGREVLRRLRHLDPDLPVLLLSGHGDVPIAVEVMREGAFDFLEKPYGAEQLATALDRAVEIRRIRKQSRLGRLQDAGVVFLESRLAGVSYAISELRAMIARLADNPVDMLLRGEPGVGKEQFARALHEFGKRSRRPFVVIDCAPRAELAFEAELLGHERGFVAGTSAVRIGKLEYANGGTVMFDGIDALSPSLQARILRVLKDRAVERIGSNAPRPIDIRVIAATHADIDTAVREGRLRSDLFHRLSSVDLTIPPLRERRADIPVLFARFVQEAADKFGMPMPDLLEMDLRLLEARSWPGNAAELRAEAERRVLSVVQAHRVPFAATTLAERVAQFEADTISDTLQRCGGKSAEAAELLGMPRRTLNEKIAKYQLRLE